MSDKYDVKISGCTQKEAVELIENYAGGAVLFCDHNGKPETPDRYKGPLFCYPKDEICSITPTNRPPQCFEGGDPKTCECPDHGRSLIGFEHD